MKTITHTQYLQLVGLMALAADHRATLTMIASSARALLGDETEYGGHTDDAVWGGDLGVQQLLDRLQITVVSDEPATAEDWRRRAEIAEAALEQLRAEIGAHTDEQLNDLRDWAEEREES